MRVDTGRLRVVEIDGEPDDALDEGYDLDDLDGGPPSPGAYIQKQRQRQGISLEELAAATKIPRRSLELLEEDRYEELPGPVFVKGFLRCAARSLDVSVDAVMELLYERERAALQARRHRPTTGSHVAAAPVAPAKMPPRVRARASTESRRSTGAPSGSASTALAKLRGLLPGPHSLLWILVAVFVAFLVLTAFNLIGGGAAPGT